MRKPAAWYRYLDYKIPERMGPGIDRYVDHGIIPGSFLLAVFSNDLMAALCVADRENIENLPAYGAYLYNEVPRPCWGSPDNVANWAAERRREREANAKAQEHQPDGPR